jgi:hypothetical protein
MITGMISLVTLHGVRVIGTIETTAMYRSASL